MAQKLKLHLRRHWHWWALGGLSLFYLVLQFDRYFNILAWADTDDALQYNLSRSIADGEWLGPYNRFTLIKGVGFPVWTAFLHEAHIPLWLGNGLLMIAACAAVVYALRRLGLGRWLLVGTYGLLLFNPMVTMRIYRDDIVPAITLLVIAWIIGLFVCLTKLPKGKLRPARKDLIIFTLIGVVSLPAWYYTREDALWIMPFILVLAALALAYCLYHIRGRLKKNLPALALIIGLFALPFVVVNLVGTGIATLNKQHYGRYVINDYFSDDFKNAYAALYRVDTSQPKLLSIPVSYDMRQKLYKASPAFNELRPCLDGANGTSGFCEGFKLTGPNKSERDYEGGWFPFALRLAVERAGYYSSASKTNDFYNRMINEIDSACDSGALKCNESHMVSLMPISTKAITKALTTNLGSSLSFLLPLRASGEDFYSPINNPISPEKDVIAQYYDVRYTTPEYGTLGTLRNYAQKGIHKVYSLLNPVLLIGSILVLVGSSFLRVRRQIVDWRLLVIGWLLLGLLLLRVLMLSYVQTVSFPTIYPLYYASVYPLMFLFEAVALSAGVIVIKNIRSKNR